MIWRSQSLSKIRLAIYFYYHFISSKLYFYVQHIFRYIFLCNRQKMEVLYVLWTFYIGCGIYHVFYNTIVLRRRVCLFCALRLSARSCASYPKNVNSLNSICHRIDEAQACIGQTEDTSSAQIVSVKQIAPFFAGSGGDRWRDRVHCGHCHPQLTMWQLLKRKARSCLMDTLFADTRFLSMKWTDYRQSLHVWKRYDSLI